MYLVQHLINLIQSNSALFSRISRYQKIPTFVRTRNSKRSFLVSQLDFKIAFQILIYQKIEFLV